MEGRTVYFEAHPAGAGSQSSLSPHPTAKSTLPHSILHVLIIIYTQLHRTLPSMCDTSSSSSLSGESLYSVLGVHILVSQGRHEDTIEALRGAAQRAGTPPYLLPLGVSGAAVQQHALAAAASCGASGDTSERQCGASPD